MKILLIFGLVSLIKMFIYDIPVLIPAIVSGYIAYKASKDLQVFTPRSQRCLKSMTIVNGPLPRIVDFITNENH